MSFCLVVCESIRKNFSAKETNGLEVFPRFSWEKWNEFRDARVGQTGQ